jgi:hypothetical protein
MPNPTSRDELEQLLILAAEAQTRGDRNAREANVYRTPLDPFFDRVAHALTKAHAALKSPVPVEGED